jgi:hypothetical protein
MALSLVQAISGCTEGTPGRRLDVETPGAVWYSIGALGKRLRPIARPSAHKPRMVSPGTLKKPAWLHDVWAL